MRNSAGFVAILFVIGIVGPRHVHADKPPRGWVKVYKDVNYGGGSRLFKAGDAERDLKYVDWDDDRGDKGMGDDVSSVEFDIPPGWAVQLCEHKNYKKVLRTLTGKGRIADLGGDHDKLSSIRWIPVAE